MTLLSGSGT